MNHKDTGWPIAGNTMRLCLCGTLSAILEKNQPPHPDTLRQGTALDRLSDPALSPNPSHTPSCPLAMLMGTKRGGGGGRCRAAP